MICALALPTSPVEMQPPSMPPSPARLLADIPAVRPRFGRRGPAEPVRDLVGIDMSRDFGQAILHYANLGEGSCWHDAPCHRPCGMVRNPEWCGVLRNVTGCGKPHACRAFSLKPHACCTIAEYGGPTSAGSSPTTCRRVISGDLACGSWMPQMPQRRRRR
jgi:hypothetical protein